MDVQVYAGVSHRLQLHVMQALGRTVDLRARRRASHHRWTNEHLCPWSEPRVPLLPDLCLCDALANLEAGSTGKTCHGSQHPYGRAWAGRTSTR
jgi:hypothetical protein